MLAIPSEIQLDLVTPQKDLAKAFSSAAASGKAIVCVDLLQGKSPVFLRLLGSVTTDAIQVSEYGHHTIGFAFGDEEEMTAFARLVEFFDTLEQVDSEWKVNDLMKNERLYLKLKNLKDKYTTRCNLKLTPKNPSSAPIYRHQALEAQVFLKAYFNLESKVCGLYLEVSNLVFQKDEPASTVNSPVKKRR